MKLVIQRCQEASVSVNGKTVGAIDGADRCRERGYYRSGG